MRYFFSFLLSFMLLLSFSLSAAAVEEFDEEEVVKEDNGFGWLEDLPAPDDLPITTHAPEPAEPITDPPLPDLQASADIVPLDNTYSGAWSGAVLDYFEGYVLNHFTEHYVAFRSSQYVYHLYIGNIKYDNGRYVGDDLIVVTYTTNYTQSNEYVSVGSGRLNQLVDGIYYSDLEGGSAFVSQKICFILFCLGVLSAVFFLARLFHSFFARSR